MQRANLDSALECLTAKTRYSTAFSDPRRINGQAVRLYNHVGMLPQCAISNGSIPNIRLCPHCAWQSDAPRCRRIAGHCWLSLALPFAEAPVAQQLDSKHAVSLWASRHSAMARQTAGMQHGSFLPQPHIPSGQHTNAEQTVRLIFSDFRRVS